MPSTRRLAAVLAADVAGYSRLMGEDEEGTLAALKAIRRELYDPKIKEHYGRIVKTTGDGVLVEFASVVDAVRCAVDIQRDMALRNAGTPDAKRIELRIGINLGDIIIDGRDIFGDGVNVAARLEALAEPGGICVSRVVRDQVRDKLDFAFEDRGEQQVKNIARPVRVFDVRTAVESPPSTPGVRAAPPLPLPEKPSIAVLPFQNLSGDPEQEYFADGVVEDIITALSRNRAFFVISRNTTFTYKGPAVDVAKVARELGVRYVLEGSVRRAGDRVRITAQLIDARADRHLWSQTFERKSNDVLALQAELASAIAGAINVQLTPREQSRLSAAPSVDPEAHDAYLKGRFFFNRPSDENLQKAIAQFDTVIKLSPTFAPAYSGLSDALIWAAYNEGFIRAVDAKPRVKAAAEQAVQLDSMSAEAHTSLGVYKAWFEYDWEGSERELRRAIALNPSYAYAHDQLNQMLGIIGRFDEAIAAGQRAVALDPLSPSILDDLATTMVYAKKGAPALEILRKAAELDRTFFFPLTSEGILALQTGNFREAIEKFERSRTLDAPPFTTAYLAYAYGMSGDRTRAMATLAALKKMSPRGEVAPFSLALVHLGLGDRTRTLDYLEQAYAASSELLVWLKIDRIYDPLRSEPRFIALMKRLNFVK
jgi:adenylate cyclase